MRDFTRQGIQRTVDDLEMHAKTIRADIKESKNHIKQLEEKLEIVESRIKDLKDDLQDGI